MEDSNSQGLSSNMDKGKKADSSDGISSSNNGEVINLIKNEKTPIRIDEVIKGDSDNLLEKNVNKIEESKEPSVRDDEKDAIHNSPICKTVSFQLNDEKNCGNINSEATVEERVVNLEELSDVSQSNEEFYSAKEFNFGIEEPEEIIKTTDDLTQKEENKIAVKKDGDRAHNDDDQIKKENDELTMHHIWDDRTTGDELIKLKENENGEKIKSTLTNLEEDISSNEKILITQSSQKSDKRNSSLQQKDGSSDEDTSSSLQNSSSSDEKVPSSLQNISSSDEELIKESNIKNSSDETTLELEHGIEKTDNHSTPVLDRDLNGKTYHTNVSTDKQTSIFNELRGEVPTDFNTKGTLLSQSVLSSKEPVINLNNEEKFEHFKDLDSLSNEAVNDDLIPSPIPTVASITTSVIDIPCSEKLVNTVKETDRLSKNSLDSLENDSLNSEGCISADSNESLDRISALNDRKIPMIVVSDDAMHLPQAEVVDCGFGRPITSLYKYGEHTVGGSSPSNDGLKSKTSKVPFLSDVESNGIKMPFPVEIQTCGKCDEGISRQIEKKMGFEKELYKCKATEVKQTNGEADDARDNFHNQGEKFLIKNGSYHTLDETRSPRGSEQLDDAPTLTDISPEKRGSIFAKMSTLPLGGTDGSGGKDSNKSCLLEDDSPKFDWRKLLAQVLAVSAKNTLALNFGLSIGFQTIAIPSLSKPNEDLYLDEQQISLFGSLFLSVIPVGCLLSGPTIHGWGRKLAMLVFCIPLFVGWWIYYVANSPMLLYTAILLMGLVNGLLEAPVLTYVAEVTEARWRGTLASSSTVAALLGVFLQLVFGTMFTWRTAAAVNSIFPVISFIAICFVPESPHWLASKGRVRDVEKSLMWLRGWTDSTTVALEVESLMAAHKKPKVAGTPLSCKAYASRTFIEPFLLVLASFAIGHFTGMATVQTYAVKIFDTLGVSGWSWTAGLGATQVFGGLACVIVLPMIGKRPIAVMSMVGVTIGMTGAALASGPLAASGLLLANFCTNACSRVIPWVLIGEVFTNEMRAVASGITSCLAYALGFVVSFTFLQVEAAMTLNGVLAFYAAVGLIGAFAYYAFLPETEGKSLAEVQEHFAKKANRRGVDNLAFEKDRP